MIGSDSLAIHESLIEDIQSLKQKVAQYSDELKQLTDQKNAMKLMSFQKVPAPLFRLFFSVIFEIYLFFFKS